MMLSGLSAQSQCPATSFTIPTTACVNGNVQIANSSTIGNTYAWDFCSGDLTSAPSASSIFTDSFLARARSFKMVQASGNWYGFAIDQVNNKLLRFNFGANPSNAPSMTNLGDLGNQLQNAFDLYLYQEGNLWYALIANTATNNILKLQFGSSLESVPVTTNLGSLGVINVPNGISGVVQNGLLTVFVSNGGTAEVVKLDFGNSINNVPITTVYPVTNGSGLRGISFVKECDRWFGLVTSYNNGKLFYLDFINGIGQAPVSGEISTGAVSLSFPAAISTALEGGSYFAFIQSAYPGNLYRVDFGPSIIDQTGTTTDLGNLSGTTTANADNFAFTIAHQNSDWFGFFIDNAGSRLMRLPFTSVCNTTIPVSNSYSPIVSYTQAGTYKISQTATDANGNLSSQAHSITISSSLAPDIDFTSQNICANHDVIFNSLNTSQDIVDSEWTFGDGGVSSLENPTYQYAVAGTFSVNLLVTASNTCENFVRKTISIYNQPAADFTTPSVSPVCTNQNFIFDNTTIFDVGYTPTWEWKVNGTSITSNEDLSYTFLSTSSQEIRLKASIPGCENEMIKNINSLVEGPVTDFSFSGQCEDENVSFTNSSSGTITGYSWNFDDGQNSTDINPTHIFSAIGTYDVTLTASNSITGCNNTKTKPVTIYSKPQTNFLLSPPPFSCNGTPSQFNDLTPNPPDSNVASWAWNFGDPGSSQNTSTLKNPQHTYANAGNYNVLLLVTTNFFCSATLQLPVAISQAPVANFNHGATCEDVASNFSDASSGTISTWNWTIGSTAYTTQNPSHTFNNSGNTSATLTVTASNGCIGTVNKPIVVPVKLAPDFSVNRNCVNQQTVFTDLTNATADPLSLQSWNFGSQGTATGSPVNVTFPNTGSVTVSLAVATQSGCVYPVSKLVNIISSPQASFNPSPVAGSPPLSVVFTNTSVNATSYQWAFRDQNNSTSTAVSPTFVYQSLGEYQPELTAFNAQNCFHTTSRTIRVVVPTLDIALDGLELMEFQNGFKPAVTIFNRGNVPVINPALLLNMSGSVIREHVNATITSNTSYRHVFSFEFPASSAVDYFCVETEVMDITPTDNEVCLSLEQSFTTFPPYPNPSKGSFQLDWIMKEAGTVSLTVINSMGQEMQNLEIESVEGLNPLTIETQGLSSGVYFVKIKYQQFTKVYRVFISE